MSDCFAKTFSDLPTDVIKVIVGKLKLKEQLILRKVSSLLRDIIDTQKLDYNEIHIDARADHINVQFNTYAVAYSEYNKTDNFDWFKKFRFESMSQIRMWPGGDWIRKAFVDLEMALKNPKNRFFMIRIDSMDDYTGNMVYRKLNDILQTLGDRKIHVNRFFAKITEKSQLFSILPHLQPGFLEAIEIDNQVDFSENIDLLIDSEQLEKAKEMDMNAMSLPIPIEKLVHLKRFDVWIDNIEIQDLLKLRDDLSISPIFETCAIRSYSGSALEIVEVQKILGLKQRDDESPNSMLIYTIPNSNAILEIYVDHRTVYIDKCNYF